jgi:hypothetical protein
MPWGKGLRTPGCTAAQPHSFNGSYAFIKPEWGDSDIFAHVSELHQPPFHGFRLEPFSLALS